MTVNQLKKRFHNFLCLHIWMYSGKPKTIAEGVWRIYNESPIRQERAFPHYGTSLEACVSTYKHLDGNKISVYPVSRVCVNCARKEVHFGNGLFVKMVQHIPTPEYDYCFMEDEIREG